MDGEKEQRRSSSGGDQGAHSHHEEHSVEDATKLQARLVYEVIRREGEDELARPLLSLAYSGLAAGLMISFSVVAEGVLRAYLPDADWSYLVENLGYSVGFLVVILGRMQLFTENTITSVLPLMSRPSLTKFRDVARLWAVVLAANLAGAVIAASFIVYGNAFEGVVMGAIVDLSHHAIEPGPWLLFWKAVPAGVLVAAIVWMMPSCEGNEFSMILAFTWLIAAGGFAHIVAGSVEASILVLRGELGVGEALSGFTLPVLAGNIVGGTLVFALLAWGQVHAELARVDDA